MRQGPSESKFLNVDQSLSRRCGAILQRNDVPPAVRIEVAAVEGAQGRLAVEDRGRGMRHDLAERVFERFQWAVNIRGPLHEGRSLLANARSIVEAKGFSIGVQSRRAARTRHCVNQTDG